MWPTAQRTANPELGIPLNFKIWFPIFLLVTFWVPRPFTINAAERFLPLTFTISNMSAISVGPWGVISGELRIERRAGSSSFSSYSSRVALTTIEETRSAGTFTIRRKGGSEEHTSELQSLRHL